MNVTAVDLSQALHLTVGDEVTLLGQEGDLLLDAQQIAEISGTVAFDILSGINARVRRLYR